MTLSIIIVSWKVKNLLQQCLRSIFQNASGVDLEIFVVDNDSRDGTAEMVCQEFPMIKLIVNERNLGFAKANNQAIKQAGGRYLLLLNPDMRVLPDTLVDMVKFMDEHSEAGVAGCHLVSEKGEIVPHVRRFPTVWDQAAIILKLPHLFPDLLDNYLMKSFDYSREAVVDSIRGSFFMIRREVIEKIGGLDERYFVWFEEVDYCRQVKQAGWKVMYNPAVKCVDYVGQSFKQMMNCKKQKMFTESMLKYFKKWCPWYKWIWIWLLRPVGLGMTWLNDSL